MQIQCYVVIVCMLHVGFQSSVLHASSSVTKKLSYDVHADLHTHLAVANFITISKHAHRQLLCQESPVLSATQFSWLHSDENQTQEHDKIVLRKLKTEDKPHLQACKTSATCMLS